MEENGKKEFQTGRVSLIGLSHLAHDIYPAFLPALAPLFAERLGLNYSMIGLMFLLATIPSILTPWIGVMADKYNFRPVIFLAPAITAVAMSFTPLAGNFYYLGALIIVAGTSSAFYHVSPPVMIKKLSGNKLGRGMSFFMFGGEIARTIGPLLILAAIDIWGVEGSYKIVFVGILMSLALMLNKNKFPEIRASSPKAIGFGRLKSSWKKQKPLYITIIGIVLSKALIIKALTSYLPKYLTENGASLWVAGASLAIFQLSGAIGAAGSGTLSDRFGRRKTLLGVVICAPFLMGLFLMAEGWQYFPLLILLGIANYSLNPIVLALVQENEKEFPASANSIFMTINFLIAALTVQLMGILSDATSLNTVYYISALVSLTGIPFILALPKKPMRG